MVVRDSVMKRTPCEAIPAHFNITFLSVYLRQRRRLGRLSSSGPFSWTAFPYAAEYAIRASKARVSLLKKRQRPLLPIGKRPSLRCF